MSESRPAQLPGPSWFRVYHQVHDPSIRLFCLPHAGGAATAYRRWPALLPADVQMLAVCYPGRQDRLVEPCLTTMEEMADRLCEAVVPYADRPVALFGHSMGAAIGYELAVRLEHRHGIVPRCLFVSGRPAPAQARVSALYRQDDATLVDEVRALGEADTVVFDDPELRALLLPALRADYQLIETYRPARPRPVSSPIVGYIGDADPVYRPDDMAGWADLTTGGCRTYTLPGGHFFLAERESEVVGSLVSHLHRHALS